MTATEPCTASATGPPHSHGCSTQQSNLPCSCKQAHASSTRGHPRHSHHAHCRSSACRACLDDAAQQVRPQLSMQGGHAVRAVRVVARLKVLAVVELLGGQEVQQGPQLLEAVLQGRSRDQQLVLEAPADELLRSGSACLSATCHAQLASSPHWVRVTWQVAVRMQRCNAAAVCAHAGRSAGDCPPVSSPHPDHPGMQPLVVAPAGGSAGHLTCRGLTQPAQHACDDLTSS